MTRRRTLTRAEFLERIQAIVDESTWRGAAKILGAASVTTLADVLHERIRPSPALVKAAGYIVAYRQSRDVPRTAAQLRAELRATVNGSSYNAAAKALGVHRTTLHDFLKSDREPSAALLRDLELETVYLPRARR
jgi:hypothetical protein